MKVLVIFSDPSDPLGRNRAPIRIDREEKILSGLGRRFEGNVSIQRSHASTIDDIHAVIGESDFDVIQFSGHGSPDGIYLDRRDMSAGGELVSARRLQTLLAIASKPPLLVILMSCYSHRSLDILAEIAPFVITAADEVDDESCLEFIGCFYERLFKGFSIKKAFDDALHILRSKSVSETSFTLCRRHLIHKGDSKFIESTPDARRNSILVNLDNVTEDLQKFKMPQEVIFQLISKKLTIHYWIFSIPRERCIIPIGKLLFGEFRWVDASDVVYCVRVMKLSANTSSQHWHVWHRLLVSYNDLASSEYRTLTAPADPANRSTLTKAVNLFAYYAKRYVAPAREEAVSLGFVELVPNFEFVLTHCEAAEDLIIQERFPQAVRALEEALTNYHEIVDTLQPPEAPPDE